MLIQRGFDDCAFLNNEAFLDYCPYYFRMLGVRPNELIFKVTDPNAPVSQCLRLKNNTDKLVGYKVKTTAPKRYKVRPTIGYLQPGGSCVELKVVLTVAKEPPKGPKPEHEDKFQIESFVCEPFPDVPQLISTKEEKNAFAKKASESKTSKKQKLTCRFQIEGENGLSEEEDEAITKEGLAESVYFYPESGALGDSTLALSSIQATQPTTTEQLTETQPITLKKTELTKPQSQLTPSTPETESADVSPARSRPNTYNATTSTPSAQNQTRQRSPSSALATTASAKLKPKTTNTALRTASQQVEISWVFVWVAFFAGYLLAKIY